MSAETVEAIADFLGEIDLAIKPLPVAWHAGEPLAVPPSFYDSAFQVLADAVSCPPLQHSLQTNATLVTDHWCELFLKWSVRVGVSIDGPEHLHDAHRRDRRHSGTLARAIRGLHELHRHGIYPSVIAVLTRASLAYPDEIWHFFRDLGVNEFAFSLEEMDGVHTSTSLCAPDARSAYYRFIRRLFELRDTAPGVRVRELDDLDQFLSLPPGHLVRSTENQPGAIITISRDGDISTFSPELLGLDDPNYGQFNWGNVHTHSWKQVTSDSGFLRTAAAISSGVSRCHQECGYFSVCGGGAPSNKLGEHSTFDCSSTNQCDLRVKVATQAALDHYGF
jgi:uncharacterized protein